MTQKNIQHTEDNEMLISEIYMKYVIYWPLLLGLVLTTTLAGFIFIRYTTPKYEANATLVIKDEKKGADDSKLIESLNIINTKKIIENETEVLQSRTLMDKVVKSLDLNAPVFIDGEIRKMSAYTISPIKIEVLNPSTIKESPKIYIYYKKETGEVFLNGKKAGQIDTWIDTEYGKIKFRINDKYVANNNKSNIFFKLIKTRDVTKSLLSNLNIKAVNKLSSIINISYKDEVPERAEEIVNTLILMYNRSAIDEKNLMAQNTLNFVEERLNSVSKDIDSIERIVQSYKSGSGSIDISSQGQYYLKNVSENDQELGRINMQLGVLDQLESNVNKNSTGGLMPATVGITDPNISKLMTDLSDKELEYERLKKTVAENNPILISLKDQINKIRPSIAENLSSQRQNLEASRNKLYATNSRYNSVLNTIPLKERQILELSRDQSVKNGIYSFLLQKREETKLAYVSNLSDARIINSALATKFPVSPNKILIYSLSISIGIGLFLLIITSKEILNKKILYRKEIEKLTRIPVVSELSNISSKESLLIEPGKRSFIAEEYRKLNVSLAFLGIGEEKNKILITSGIPGEGKSLIAANLAISNSLSGKNVLLIDLDLHKPSLGKLFNRSNDEIGMSEYLKGLYSLNEIISPIKSYKNLSIITSGSIQQNASELLLNGKIAECIKYLSGIFDLIIIDSAPTEMITDAYVVSKLCDKTLFVVRHDYTPKILIKRLSKNQSTNPLKNVSIIFNGIKTKGFYSNNYGYGYKYVYSGKNKEYYLNT